MFFYACALLCRYTTRYVIKKTLQTNNNRTVMKYASFHTFTILSGYVVGIVYNWWGFAHVSTVTRVVQITRSCLNTSKSYQTSNCYWFGLNITSRRHHVEIVNYHGYSLL